MKTLITLLLAALVVFAWGPWVDAKFVSAKLKEASDLESRMSTTSDPCNYKQVISSYKTVFGQKASVEYNCFAPFTMKRDVFISSFGTVHPLSKLKPTIEE